MTPKTHEQYIDELLKKTKMNTFMPPRKITKQTYDQYMAEISDLMKYHPTPNSPKSQRLEYLSELIEEYEDKHYPIDPPTPEEAAQFRKEQESGGEDE